MEPANKRLRLTDHFRVALKPRDLNIAPLKNKQCKQQQQENQSQNQSQQLNSSQNQDRQRHIEVITINDDPTQEEVAESKQPQQRPSQQRPDENETGPKQQTQQHGSQLQTLPLKLFSFGQPPQTTQTTQPNTNQKQPLTQQQPRQHLGPIVLNTNKKHTNNHSQAAKGNKSSISSCQNNNNNVNLITSKNKSIKSFLIKPEPSPLNKYSDPPGKHTDVFDYDRTLVNNVCWEPHYAWDSFQYDRQQEIKYKTTKPLYMAGQNLSEAISLDEDSHINYTLTPQKRAELVDWLVDIQINFDLDHEPLYMAVKLVDQYLMLKQVERGNYELLFMVSMLIAAKFDERIPPITISELIQVTKNRFGVRYTRKQVVGLEVDMLTTLQFDIRFPLSYGFLRRFARCTRSDTRTLYLARYILESSLMDQDMIEVIESKIAAGSLLLAFEMLHKNGAWDETAKYYTGYDEEDLYPILVSLNAMIIRLSRKRTSIRKKYSHESYMEVARIPTLVVPQVILSSQANKLSSMKHIRAH